MKTYFSDHWNKISLGSIGKGGRTNLKTEGVVAVGVRGVESLAFDVVAPPTIIVGVWTKVQSAGGNIVTALSVGVIVAARFHNVNFTRARPVTVDAVLGQHPDGGPKPVTSRQLGLDLDAAILDGGTKFCVDTT